MSFIFYVLINQFRKGLIGKMVPEDLNESNVHEIQKLCTESLVVKLLKQLVKELSLCHKLNFLIPISLQTDDVNL